MIVHLDDAESVLWPVAGAAERGWWRSRDLEHLWDGLCALPVAGGPTPTSISCTCSWSPVLDRLGPDARSWVVKKLQGHPRSVECKKPCWPKSSPR